MVSFVSLYFPYAKALNNNDLGDLHFFRFAKVDDQGTNKCPQYDDKGKSVVDSNGKAPQPPSRKPLAVMSVFKLLDSSKASTSDQVISHISPFRFLDLHHLRKQWLD